MFHFGQCVWRRLQSQGSVGRYRDEPDFALRTKSLLALAFVPPADVHPVYESLIADPAYRDLDAICEYMEDNFIGRGRRGARGQPRFSIELWNQYSRVIANLPRSNNNIEGWHNAFNNVVGAAHPKQRTWHENYTKNSIAPRSFVVNWNWEYQLEKRRKHTSASTNRYIQWRQTTTIETQLRN
jgi:hypothetical protein